MAKLSREERFFSGLPELPPDSTAFAKHYLALPTAGAVPSLESFLDHAPYEFMPRVAIIDLRGRDDYRIRYFGTALTELTGEDYTGFTATEFRARGIVSHTGTRGWDIANHPCGYLSTRLLLRQNHPEKMTATFELLTLALPIIRGPGFPCVLNYYSLPRLAQDQSAPPKGVGAYRVVPLCWIDVGAGIPNQPI
jgi:hypothetical protein